MSVWDTLMKIESMPIIPKSDGESKRAKTMPVKKWTPCRENLSMALQIIPCIDFDATDDILNYGFLNSLESSHDVALLNSFSHIV